MLAVIMALMLLMILPVGALAYRVGRDPRYLMGVEGADEVFPLPRLEPSKEIVPLAPSPDGT